MAEGGFSLGTFKEQFDDQLTCSVCLDQYTNPKTLPCLHSFCLKCIQPLPIILKDGNYYISCPTCRVNHLIPEGGAINLPNAFHINSFLDLRKRLTITKSVLMTCPKHNDPLKVYCETCRHVICRDCTISKEHNTHKFELISECYPKHHQQIEASLDLVKHKMADLNTAVTQIDTSEREVMKKGEQLQEQINTHAQQIIDQVERSRERLSQQLHNIVKQKTQLLTAQKQQAQKLNTQLNTCQEMIEHSLKEWTQLQILTEKHTMINQMNTATQHVDLTVFQPIENADMKFTETNAIKNEIGFITSTLPVIPTPEMRGKPVNIITRLKAPWGIAVCDNGDIVVAEFDVHCITTLNKDGKKMKSFDTKGTKEGQFTYPCGVAITNDGHILVTDNHRLQKLTTDGVCVKSVGSSNRGSGQLQFNDPSGITVHPTTGQIFVADAANSRIQVFNNNLTFSHTITPSGNKPFDCPWDVAIDNEGYLYVAELNDCIKKLTTKGQYVTRFCSRGSAPGQLSSPSSLTINNGLVYVTEYGNSRVSIFNTNGTFLHCFGKIGTGEGQFNQPHGITIDTLGNLYVCDSYNNRIVVC